MPKNLETILQPQVAEYLMEKMGQDLNTLDVASKLTDWGASPSDDGGTARIRATIEYEIPMARFRGLVAEAARREDA